MAQVSNVQDMSITDPHGHLHHVHSGVNRKLVQTTPDRPDQRWTAVLHCVHHTYARDRSSASISGIGNRTVGGRGLHESWEAVPFFLRIGYIKLLAGCMLSVYYPLYMGLALYYTIWIIKEPFPFQECSAGVKITESGYSVYGKDGQECLRETFLKSPFAEPSWYGIYAGIMLLGLNYFFFPTIACYVALMAKSIMQQEEANALEHFLTNVDWKSLTDANIWYYACIQVFFSTNVGLGPFMTNAAVIYSKDCLRVYNGKPLIGIGIYNHCSHYDRKCERTANEGDVAELHLMTLIYNTARSSTKDDIKYWLILAYLVTLMHTIVKAVSTLSWNRLNWWQTCLITGLVGYILGCAILLQTEFDIVHLLDHYIVGNLILIIVIIEVFALITFYGTERIKSDFEFMLGHILSKIWLVLWWLLPLLLTAIFAWG
ncbi:hypothetical protein NQ318_016919 [Aromia moschata]|uniref:Uncharacterized protein n=1 Tax=Aromia moschata TaxID=1265417 RepID=A0AAV8XKM2_9CUCU|nr:hypothetical protein NQ318_016919 [Aromia moschata]